MAEPEVRPRAGDAALLRALGFWALAASIVNVTIGTSIFALPGSLAASMGAAAPLAFVLGGALFVPVVLCFAVAGSRVTATGGPYSYVDAAFGRFPGFAIAAIFWISNVAGSGSLSAALADQVAQLFPSMAQPVPRGAFLVAEYLLLVALNVRGVRAGTLAIGLFTAAKVIPLLILIGTGIPHVRLENLHIGPVPTLASIGTSLVIVVFAYSGIETALAPSGEIRDPSTVVPRAAIAGVALVIALYVGLQIVAQGVLGGSLAGAPAPLAAVAAITLPAGAQLMVATATVSLVGCLQGELLGSSRLLYALARDGYLPRALARISEQSRVPTRAILVHAASGCALACAGSFTTLALVSGGAFCVVYIAVCAAAWRLQRRDRGVTSALRLPGGALIPAIGIAGLTAILATLQRAEWLALGCAASGCAVLYALRRFTVRP